MEVRHNQLSSNLIFLRESMQLSRQNLADIVGSSPSHIAKLETGKTADPSWTVVSNLARYFGVGRYSLMHDSMIELDRKKQALRRVSYNFTDDQWEMLIDFIETTTKRQAKDGVFLNTNTK